MSDAPDLPEDDLLAGEYVLGVLTAEQAAAARIRAETNPALLRAIADWERRLAPIAWLAPPVAPPAGLWPRIAASIRVTQDNRPGLWRSIGFWRGATAASLAIAASLAVVAVLPRQTPPAVMAVLVPKGAKPAAFQAVLQADGTVRLRALNVAAVPQGRDLELWFLAAGEKTPHSLGVISLQAQNATKPTRLAPGTQLLVSLEPKGGSPTGLPTGPVLYGGRLE